MSWEQVGRPGYFGSRRNAMRRLYDDTYGADRWRLVWQAGKRICTLPEAVMVYEDAYYIFLQAHSKVSERLVGEAHDVYDDCVSNVMSALDYLAQETDRTHVQDIAIRRCVIRLGLVMHGPELVQIRDEVGAARNRLSLDLSPGRVPFHKPDWLIRPEISGWWQPGTIESWYQSSKLLQVWTGDFVKAEEQ